MCDDGNRARYTRTARTATLVPHGHASPESNWRTLGAVRVPHARCLPWFGTRAPSHVTESSSWNSGFLHSRSNFEQRYQAAITAAFMPARDNTSKASHIADAEDADDIAEVPSGRDRGVHRVAIDVSASACDDGQVAALGIARLAEVGSEARRALS